MRKRNRRPSLPVLIAVALAVVAAIAWRLLPRVDDPPAEVVHEVSLPPESRAAAQDDVVPTPSPSPTANRNAALPAADPPAATADPLPPLDATVGAIYDALAERAMRGDRAAACRLAMDLDLCKRWPKLPEAAAQIETAAVRATPGSSYERNLVRQIEDLAGERGRADAICRDASWDQIFSAWKFLVRAAELGDSRAAVQFARNPPLDRVDFLLDYEGWGVYRERAFELLQAAMQRGSVDALLDLQRAAAGRGVRIGGGVLMRRDPLRAATYSIVLQGYVDAQSQKELDDQIAALREKLGAEQFARAERDAEALAPRFSGQRGIDLRGYPPPPPLRSADCRPTASGAPAASGG